MTKRSSNQEVDEVGENQLGLALRPYAVEKYDNDYGIDFIVNLTDEPDNQGRDDEPQKILSDHFFIQLKSTTRFDPDTDTVHEDLEVRHLEQYIDQPIPVILAIYDDNTEEIYWRIVQEYIWDQLDKEKPNWRSQQTVRIKVHRSQVITDYGRLEQAVNRTQSRITRRKNQGLNIGEGVAFTPNDFSELEKQKQHERLSYRGHTLLIARQHLKRGNEEQARESLAEILDAEYDDEATVKALFVQLLLWNPMESAEAIQIAELAHKACELAAELGMKTDQRLATIFLHVAGLFILAENRQQVLVNDRIQSLEEFEVPEYDYPRNAYLIELYSKELEAMNAISGELSALLEENEYYVYAVALPKIIDYLTRRRNLQLLNELGPKPSENGDEGAKSAEELAPGDIHPLVEQAEQLADFVPEPDAEANLRKSVGLYRYYSRNPDTATEYLSEARELAAENDNIAFEEALNGHIQRIAEVQNPYDVSQYPDDDEEEPERQEAAKMILGMQGINVDLENPPDSQERDPVMRMAYYAVRDADPEAFYKHCEHLHLADKPSTGGRRLGMTSFGTKYLWCQHGGLMSGVDLTSLFDRFKSEYCDGCEHHCPRPDDWELTNKFAQEQVKDPDFQAELDRYESATMGGPMPENENRTT